MHKVRKPLAHWKDRKYKDSAVSPWLRRPLSPPISSKGSPVCSNVAVSSWRALSAASGNDVDTTKVPVHHGDFFACYERSDSNTLFQADRIGYDAAMEWVENAPARVHCEAAGPAVSAPSGCYDTQPTPFRLHTGKKCPTLESPGSNDQRQRTSSMT